MPSVAGPGPEEQFPNPFGGMPLFGDLARMLSGQGPVNWDVAKQMARWLATGGGPEANVDPLIRVRFEELYRIAEMHVAEATGLLDPGFQLEIVTRSEWAASTLEAWRPLMELLASSLTPEHPASDEAGAGDPEGQMMAGLAKSLSPLLLGLQSGSMVGHLSQQSLGTYDLPVPRSDRRLLVVPANVDAFAEEWSLPADDARLYVAVAELTHHAVFSVDHVRARFAILVEEFLSGFEPDPSALEARLGGIDPTDMEAMQSALGDPEALLGAMASPAQQKTAAHLSAAVAALIGYVDHLNRRIGERLVGNQSLLAEAQKRRRLSSGQGERFVQRLFGLEITRDQLDRGATFVAGVIERAGEEALAGLWARKGALPTAAEIQAPGLWLERISYDDPEPDDQGENGEPS